MLISTVNELGYAVLFSERNGNRYAYIKESDAIEEMLTIMGAEHAAMEVLNVKIYKNMRNTANRITNCETANIQKSVNASSDIIDKIHKIFNVKGKSFIDGDLLETAELRIENPELSLRELADMFTPPISRSGLNHRLKKLSQIAEEIMEEKKKQ